MRLGMGMKLGDRLTFGAAPIPDSTLLTGLVSYWKLDETSGTRVDSVTASGNDLSDNNTVGSAAGKVGNAASFVGTNAERLTLDSFTLADTSSVSMWVKSATLNNEYFVLFGDDGTYDGSEILVYGAAGNTLVLYSRLTGAVDTVSASAGAWHHVFVTHNRATKQLAFYVDGNAGPASPVTYSSIKVTDSMSVGAQADGGQPLTGEVDELSVWSRILTADERAALYNSGDGVTWPFTGVSLP